MDSEVTLKQLQDFHTIDREAYARLMIGFGFDPCQSKKIIAFWNFLESSGYKNFVKKTQLLPDTLFFTLIHETTKCLNCLTQISIPHVLDDHINDVPFMRSFVGKKISLKYIYENKENAMKKIQSFMSHVCERAFVDIIPMNTMMMGDCNCDRYCNWGPYYFKGAFETQQPHLIYGSDGGFDHGFVMEGGDYGDEYGYLENNVPESERTLFVTFSRGHPITKKGLKAFFNRNFGYDFVESIRMPRSEPILYARVIVRSLSCIARVLEGNEVVQFCVRGKDIRVRRFVKKHA